jgi:rubrerythrin
MSVLIKGLEMPETEYMDVRIFRDGTATIATGTKPYYRELKAEPVRHGMFIGTEYDGYADGYPVYYEWKCSECGCIFEEDEPTYRYCPNCGCRMDRAKPKE